MGRLQGFRFQLPSNPFSAARKKPPVPRLVLYKGRGMLPFRLIVRAKVFQAVGAFTIAMLVSAMITAQDFKPWDLAAAGGLALGCVVTSYCVWYYSSRYVGELSLLLPDRRVARFSVLDFYGNRQDDDIPVEDIVAPFHNRTVGQVKALTARVLLPVDVRGGEHQYYISVAHGYILEKQVLLRLFYGKHLDDLDAELAARTALAGQAPEPAGPAAGLAGQTAATSAGHSAGSPGSASADGAAVADLSAPAPATPARRE